MSFFLLHQRSRNAHYGCFLASATATATATVTVCLLLSCLFVSVAHVHFVLLLRDTNAGNRRPLTPSCSRFIVLLCYLHLFHCSIVIAIVVAVVVVFVFIIIIAAL